jgi:hypothetical protein
MRFAKQPFVAFVVAIAMPAVFQVHFAAPNMRDWPIENAGGALLFAALAQLLKFGKIHQFMISLAR